MQFDARIILSANRKFRKREATKRSCRLKDFEIHIPSFPPSKSCKLLDADANVHHGYQASSILIG